MEQAEATGVARSKHWNKEKLHRGPDDDFFCLRFGVWYPSIDCAVRTEFETCQGCLDCDQGRFNLKRHAGALGDSRLASRLREAAALISSSPTT